MKSSLLNRVLSVLCTFSLIFTTASPVSLAGSLKSESGRRSVSSVSEEADHFLPDDSSPSDIISPGVTASPDTPLRSYFSDEVQEAKDDTIRAEIIEKRDPFNKHFRLTDGTYAAVTYDHQIHERIGTEETYREIDNRLVKTKSQDGLFVYTKQTPGFVQAVFSAEPSDPGLLSGKLLTLQDGENSFTWGILSEKPSPALTVTYEEQPAEEGHERLCSKAVSGILRYEEILPGTTLIYHLIGNDVKEDLIIGSLESFLQAGAEYSFLIHSETLTIEQQEGDNRFGKENAVRLYDETGEEIRSITAPYMEDANGIKSKDLDLLLEETEGGYLVRLYPDEDFMTSPQRAYPVTIDPTISASYFGYSSIKSTSVQSENPDSNAMYGYGEIYVGREAGYGGNLRGALKIETLPSLGSDDMVIASTLRFNQKKYSGPGSVAIRLHRFIGNISLSALTWNNIQGLYEDTVIDMATVTGSDTGNYIEFDVTKAVKGWYLNGNYGLALTSENEFDPSHSVWLHSSTTSNTPSPKMPTLTVHYLNQSGIESHLTYHSMGTSTLGTILVGDFNGNMVYSYTDLSMTGAHLPITVSHVYNHSKRSNGSIVSSSAHYGSGYQLNVTEKIIAVTGELGNTFPYALLDGDGTLHYFLLKSGTQGAVGSVYEKEYESTTLLTKTSGGYTLTDGGTLLYTFTNSSYGSFLTEIKDITNNKTQTFTYTGGRLTSITDGDSRTVTLSYDSGGYLTSLTDPAGRSTTYEYASGLLLRINRPDGTYITYDYAIVNDNTWHLVNLNDVDGKHIQMNYKSDIPYRVNTVAEYASDWTHGYVLCFDYYEGETEVTDTNDLSETMLFDNAGHTVVVRDNAGNAVFGSHGSTEDDQKHALLYQSRLQGSVTNYLKNGGFENNRTGWTNVGSGTGSNTIVTSSKEGAKALKIKSTSSEDYGVRQTVTNSSLKGKTVTFSAYLSFPTFTYYADTGTDISILYYNGSGTLVEKKSRIRKAEDDFGRYSVTAEIPSNSTSNTIYVQVKVSGSAYAIMDNAQLETGAVANRYNLVENGSFYDTAGTLTPNGWTTYNFSTGDGVVSNGRSGNGCHLSGYQDVEKYLYQSIPIKSGQAGDQYVFSAWAKADSLPKHYLLRNTERPFAIRFRFVRSDDTYDETEYDFEAKTSSWQYLSGNAVAETAYARVELWLVYDYQKNDVIFDDVQVYRERFGTRMNYDSEGRLIESIDPAGLVTSYSYVASGRPEISSVTYPDGSTYTYNYDTTTRRLLSTTDPSGVTTTYQYDPDGNATGSTTVSGSLTMSGGTVSYSGAYLSSATDNLGHTESYTYNQQKGTLTSLTNPKSVTTSYTYNALNDYLTSVSSSGSMVSYSYTNGRYLSGITHNNTSTTSVGYSFTYDMYGNRASTKVGTVTLSTETYGSHNGFLTGVSYGNGTNITYSYDSLGRISTVSYNGIATYRYHYGADGKVGLIEDLISGEDLRYEYDEQGRVLLSDGTRYTYNAIGELTDELLQDGSDRVRTSFAYEGTAPSGQGKRLLSMVEWRKQDVSSTTPDLARSYHYDGLYRLSYSDTATGGSSGIRNTYSYQTGTGSTATGQVSGLSVKRISNNTTIKNLTYSYDALGNIYTVSEGGTEKIRYTYDGLNELIREDNKYLNKTVTYSYDLGGNLLYSKEYAYTTGSVANLTPTKTDTYTYGNGSWKDQLTKYNGNSITYDAIGNPLSYYNGTTFTWEKGRRLKTAAKNGVTTTYTYDASGRRTGKTVGSTTTEYILSDGLIAGERTGSTSIWYYHDESGSPVGFSIGTDYYLYLKDLQGDVIGILDSTLTLVTEYTYDAWGKVVSISGNTTLGAQNPIRYRGYYYDNETGFYYLGSRYYDPTTRRFLNADGLLSTGQGILGYNMYAYCLNNPVRNVDEDGCMARIYQLCRDTCLSNIDGLCVAFTVAIGATLIRGGFALAQSDFPEQVAKGIRDIAESIAGTIEEYFDQSVYLLYAGKGNDKKVIYVGRSNDPERRFQEHMRDPKKIDAGVTGYDVVATGLSPKTARTMEQLLISAFVSEAQINARREIAVGNLPKFIDELKRISGLLRNYPEEELYHLMHFWK